jgi:hypothetical protein
MFFPLSLTPSLMQLGKCHLKGNNSAIESASLFSCPACLVDCDQLISLKLYYYYYYYYYYYLNMFNVSVLSQTCLEPYFLYYTTSPSRISRIIFSTKDACIQQLIAFCCDAINVGVQGIYENQLPS